MSANSAVKRDVLNFEPNQWYQIALKYETGRQIRNGSIMFSTTDDEVFFLSPFEADQIYDLQLQPGELFKITRKVARGQDPKIVVSRANQQQQPGAVRQNIPAAAATAKPESANHVSVAQTQQPQHTAISELMASSYLAAMDALVEAQQGAQARGLAFKISTMELRACAHCIFIALTKGGSWQQR